MADLFTSAGLGVTFVDTNLHLVSALKRAGRYTLHIVGPSAVSRSIADVSAESAFDGDRVADLLAGAAVAASAVGAAALPNVATALRNGLARRPSDSPPLNTILCENLYNAGALVQQLVCPAHGQQLNAGFPQAVVSRMVPFQPYVESCGASLDIRAEAYASLPIDAHAVVGAIPNIPGVLLVDNFPAWEARKLFGHNCAHAALGYLGARSRCEFGWSALEDPEILVAVRSVLSEVGSALAHTFGFDRGDLENYGLDLLLRFSNRDLADSCRRLARDPLRKLAPNDRLVGAARLCENANIAAPQLTRVIAAALAYYDAEDDSSVRLREMANEIGIGGILETVCGIQANERLASEILAAYSELRIMR